MKNRYLSENTIESINLLRQIKNNDELIAKLEELFVQSFTLPALWEFKSYFDRLSDDEIIGHPILIEAKCFYALNSGDLTKARRYYELYDDDNYKLIQKIMLPDTPYEEYKDCILHIIKNDLGPIKNINLTAGRPSVINGIRDFTPQLKEFEKNKESLELILKDMYGEYATGVIDIGRAEYLYQIDKCYEALVLVVANIQFLNKPEHARTLFVALFLEINIMLMNGQVSSAGPMIKRIFERLHKDGLEELIPNVRALEAWAAMYDGDYERVNRWMSEDAPNEYLDFCMLDLFQYMVKMKIYLIQEKYLAITSLCMRLEPLLEKGYRYKDLCELHLIWSMSDYMRGDKQEAFKHLDIALELAEKYSYDRLIADESDRILKILIDYEKEFGKDIYLTYVISLTKTTARRFPRYLKKRITYEKELSNAELTVLRLIADDKSNQEIADLLNITLNTVKFHNKNIFKKLKVKNRRQAVRNAHELGVIELNNLQRPKE